MGYYSSTTTTETKLPEMTDDEKKNRAMFDAAIQSGVKEGFNVAYQDKQNGLISLEKLKGSGTCDADVRKYCSQLFPRRILLAHYKAPLQPENPTRELA